MTAMSPSSSLLYKAGNHRGKNTINDTFPTQQRHKAITRHKEAASSLLEPPSILKRPSRKRRMMMAMRARREEI